MIRRVVFSSAIVLVGLLCGASHVQAEKRILTVGMGSADAGKLDPHLTATTPDKGLLNWMFNGLVRIKPGQVSPEYIEPDIAQSWTSNPAATEWTFKIRPDVQCHHGYGEFTSEDAAYSLRRAATKATSSFSSDFASFDNVEAVDKLTLKITLKNPVPGFLGYLVNYHGGNMVCKKAAEEMQENFSRKPIGTGPAATSPFNRVSSTSSTAGRSRSGSTASPNCRASKCRPWSLPRCRRSI